MKAILAFTCLLFASQAGAFCNYDLNRATRSGNFQDPVYEQCQQLERIEQLQEQALAEQRRANRRAEQDRHRDRQSEAYGYGWKPVIIEPYYAD